MPVQNLTGIIVPPKVNVSKYRLERLTLAPSVMTKRADTSQFPRERNALPATVMTQRAVIREDLKAGGTLQRSLSAEMTPQGPKVDLNV